VARILLNTWRRQGRVFGPALRDMFGVEVQYVQALQRAGAQVFLAPQGAPGAAPDEVLEGFCGLLIIGGEDLARSRPRRRGGRGPDTISPRRAPISRWFIRTGWRWQAWSEQRKVLAASAAIMMRVDEVILRDVVIQFDGRVVEVCGSSSGSLRHHVALLKEPQVRAPDRKGRSLVTLAGTMFGVDADELPRLTPFLEKVREAVRIASDRPLAWGCQAGSGRPRPARTAGWVGGSPR
jgi:hypothetical protein